MTGKPTIQQVGFQLEIQDCLLEMMAEGLDFLSKDSENRIVYVVDYTEVRPYWEAARPQKKSDLSNEWKNNKIKYIRDYLLPIEDIFLELDDNHDREDQELIHLQKAYDEQMELINSLLCDKSFATIMLPNHWEYLRSDISYFANQVVGATANYNSSIEFSKQHALKTVYEFESYKKQKTKKNVQQPSLSSEKAYVKNSETFGVWSLKLERASSFFKLIATFVENSNFCLPTDFPWGDRQFSLSKNAVDNLHNLQTGQDIDPWLKWLDEGNDKYNSVYGSSGKWHLRKNGAENLAFVQKLDELVQKARGSNIRIALVTRNNQIQQAVWQARDREEHQNAPWVFHPRLLTAFMIDQSAGKDTSDAAFKLEKNVRELQGTVQIVNEFIHDISENENSLSSPLSNFLHVRLRRSWEEYRRGNLALRIKDRIIYRKNRWLLKERPRRNTIEGFLKEVISRQFEFIKVERERSLLWSLPTERRLWAQRRNQDDGRFIRIKHEDPDIGALVLFKGNYFTHAFLFQSEPIKSEIFKQCELPLPANDLPYCQISISNILSNVAEELETRIKDSTIETIELHREFRFDVLLMCAAYLSSTKIPIGDYKLPKAFLDAAREIWSDDSSTTFSRQISEINYLSGILRRLDWRKRTNQSDTDPYKMLQEGKMILKEIEGYQKYDEDNIRIILLLVGFVRELYSFYAEKLSTPGKPSYVGFSVTKALDLLDEAYDLSIRREFCFGAARAKQQFLAFVRMWNAEKLPKSKKLHQLLDNEKGYKAHKELVRTLDHLRNKHILRDNDIPGTAVVSENLGIWEYRQWYDPTPRQIRDAVDKINERMKDVTESSHKQYIDKTLKEMKKSIES